MNKRFVQSMMVAAVAAVVFSAQQASAAVVSVSFSRAGVAVQVDDHAGSGRRAHGDRKAQRHEADRRDAHADRMVRHDDRARRERRDEARFACR